MWSLSVSQTEVLSQRCYSQISLDLHLVTTSDGLSHRLKHMPHCLDFDNKRAYFRSQLRPSVIPVWSFFAWLSNHVSCFERCPSSLEIMVCDFNNSGWLPNKKVDLHRGVGSTEMWFNRLWVGQYVHATPCSNGFSPAQFVLSWPPSQK